VHLIKSNHITAVVSPALVMNLVLAVAVVVNAFALNSSFDGR
jgi:hypothetical protein